MGYITKIEEMYSLPIGTPVAVEVADGDDSIFYVGDYAGLYNGSIRLFDWTKKMYNNVVGYETHKKRKEVNELPRHHGTIDIVVEGLTPIDCLISKL